MLTKYLLITKFIEPSFLLTATISLLPVLLLEGFVRVRIHDQQCRRLDWKLRNKTVSGKGKQHSQNRQFW